MDYRDVPETGFDAISSIGITEHIGKANVDGYFKFLNGKLEVGGPHAQPLHHPAGQLPARRSSPTGSSTGTSSRTASLRVPATSTA